MLRSPRRGKPLRGPRPKRHILAPEAEGREGESEAVVYGSQNQHMHAPLLSAQVTSSSSYLSFLSMPVWKSKFYRAFVLNRRVVLHDIDAMPTRWRGDAGSAPLNGASTAVSSPRNELVKDCRCIGARESARSRLLFWRRRS